MSPPKDRAWLHPVARESFRDDAAIGGAVGFFAPKDGFQIVGKEDRHLSSDVFEQLNLVVRHLGRW